MITARPQSYLESLAAELQFQSERVRSLTDSAHWLHDGRHKEHLLDRDTHRRPAALSSGRLYSPGVDCTAFRGQLLRVEGGRQPAQPLLRSLLVVFTAPRFDQGLGVLALVAVDRSPLPPRSWAKTAGFPQVHLSDARDRRDGLRQARGVTTVEDWVSPSWATARFRCFRHQLLLPRPYLVLTKPLRLDIQCQRAASVRIGWKYLDD